MDKQQRESLNDHIGVAFGPVLDEREHFYQCKACGQMVDMRRLGYVFHHEEEGHAPLPVH